MRRPRIYRSLTTATADKARPQLFVELIAVPDPIVRHVELRPLALEQAAQLGALGNPHVRHRLSAGVRLTLDR